jgi:sulfur carrier protein ThiS
MAKRLESRIAIKTGENMITVQIGRVPGSIQRAALENGATVADAVRATSIDVSGYSPRVNGDVASNSTVLSEGDEVIFTKEIKGADESEEDESDEFEYDDEDAEDEDADDSDEDDDDSDDEEEEDEEDEEEDFDDEDFDDDFDDEDFDDEDSDEG